MTLKNLLKYFSSKSGKTTINGDLHFKDNAEWEDFKSEFKDNVVEWYISGEGDPRTNRIYDVYRFIIGNARFDAFGPDRSNPAYNPAANLVECPKCGRQFNTSELKRYVSPEIILRSGSLKGEQKQEEKQQ